jgi:predicted nucleic acid-binding protein
MPMSRLVVLDNTVLSNFALAEHVDWLGLYPVPVATTRQACAELETGIKEGRIPKQDWSWLTVLDLDTEAHHRFMELMPPLGAGEASCLSVAWGREYQVATDDKRARQKARDLGISVTGTVGILVRLVEKDLVPLPLANQALAIMVEKGYRVPFDQLDKLVTNLHPLG